MPKLARLIVKARVLDLESVPQFIVLSDAEDFHGESWTVHCEVISDEVLHGLAPDEDPLPRITVAAPSKLNWLKCTNHHLNT